MTPFSEEQEEEHKLHEAHHRYIETLIAKEEQRIKFRQAIIEKTIAALLWSVIVFIGYAVLAYLKQLIGLK